MPLLLAAGACGLVSAALLSPGLIAGPSLDAAVFALAGSLLRQGQLPYVDFWDHKPPGIYVVDAAAQSALPWVDPWVASWLASVVLVALTGVLVTATLRRIGLRWEAIAAGVATSAAAAQHIASLGGGLTESAAILPAAAALWLATGAGGTRRFLLAGVAAGAAVLTSIPALAVVAAVAVAAWRRPDRWRAMTTSVGGALVAGLLAMAVLGVAGALPDALDAVVGYSAVFHALSTGGGNGAQAAGALLSLVFLLVPAGLGALAVRQAADDRTRTLVGACLAWIVLGLVLFVAEGRFETHYAAVLAVPLGVLAGLGLRQAAAMAARSRAMAYGPLAAGLAISALVVGANLPTMMRPTSAETDRTRATARLIDEETRSGNTIFVWGNEPQVYLWSGRLPASRYVYAYPLTTPGYSTAAQVADLAAELQRHPPALIVDAGSFGEGTVGLPPLLVPRPVDSQDPRTLDLIEPLRQLVRSRYALLADVDGWPVYVLSGSGTG
jgi:hypothetical protein